MKKICIVIFVCLCVFLNVSCISAECIIEDEINGEEGISLNEFEKLLEKNTYFIKYKNTLTNPVIKRKVKTDLGVRITFVYALEDYEETGSSAYFISNEEGDILYISYDNKVLFDVESLTRINYCTTEICTAQKTVKDRTFNAYCKASGGKVCKELINKRRFLLRFACKQGVSIGCSTLAKNKECTAHRVVNNCPY